VRIGELAEAVRISADAVRYYERVGLIPKVGRQSSGYRTFPRETVARLRLIRSFQRAGLTLNEIREVLTLFDGGSRDWKELRPSVVAVHDRINEKIDALHAVRRRLSRMISMADTNTCPFLPRDQ
jgi:MerR family copper efflux transcriptional regulator